MTDIDIRHLPRDTGVATPLKMITTVHKLGWKNKSSLSIFVKVKIKTAISLLDYAVRIYRCDGGASHLTVRKTFSRSVYNRLHMRIAISVLPGLSNNSSIVKRFYYRYVNKFVTQ